MRAKSRMARMASSLPGIGKSIRSGSQLVSTMPTIGMPRRLASATAIFSFFVSTMKSSPAAAFISLMPAKCFSSLRALASSRRETSFLVSFSKVPSSAIRSRSCRRLMLILIVLKLVSMPPSQRSVT